LLISYFFEQLFYISKFFYFPISPLLTRAEVLKVGVTHFFSIEKAKKQLNYEPKINSFDGAQEMGNFYANNLHNDDFFEFVGLGFVLSILLGMVLLGLISLLDLTTIQNSSFLNFVYIIGTFIFQTQFILKIVFIVAVLCHLLEGFYAGFIAYSKCKNTWVFWFLQTVLFGYFSLRLLLKRKINFAVVNEN
jgi:hypothetical protein